MRPIERNILTGWEYYPHRRPCRRATGLKYAASLCHACEYTILALVSWTVCLAVSSLVSRNAYPVASFRAAFHFGKLKWLLNGMLVVRIVLLIFYLQGLT